MGLFALFFGRTKPPPAPPLPAVKDALRGTGDSRPVSAEEARDVLNGELIFFSSSNVACAQFHPESQRLMVEFHRHDNYAGKTVYFYRDVSREMVASFLAAPSKGVWVHENLASVGWPYD